MATMQSSDTRQSAARVLLPGVGLCAIAAMVAVVVSRGVPAASPLLVAILVGMVATNLGVVPQSARAGLAFSSKRVLRVGVALLGVQLVLSDILDLGVGMLGVIVAVVVVGITSTMAVGALMGISRTQRLLIACGFSICGAAAVAAVDGVVEAEEREVATAIGLVVIFGTLMIPLIPLAASVMGLSNRQAGLWAGGSIHEVAQVVAAGGAIGSSALAVAVVVKLGRVLMLGPVLTILGLLQRRTVTSTSANANRPPLVPVFVVAFGVMAAIRTTGVLPASAVGAAKFAQAFLLAMAMFALGCGVRLTEVRALGARTLVLAGISTLIVAVTALVGITLVG
jgi:uncharacterized integral membrane protein (TIGR00698 family)